MNSCRRSPQPVHFYQNKPMNKTYQFGCKTMTETLVGEQVMNMCFISNKRRLAFPDPHGKYTKRIKNRNKYNTQYKYRGMW